MRTYEEYISGGYMNGAHKKNMPVGHSIGHIINIYAAPETPQPAWNKNLCDKAIKEYANIIAELNIDEQRACKKHNKFVELITIRLSQRTYKTARELDEYVKKIRFDVDVELKLAGYNI